MYPDRVTMNINIGPENLLDAIWEVKLSDTTVKPGDTVKVYVSLKGFRSEPKTLYIDLAIPQECPDGNFNYRSWGRKPIGSLPTKVAPQRFTVVDAQSLIDGLKKVSVSTTTAFMSACRWRNPAWLFGTRNCPICRPAR